MGTRTMMGVALSLVCAGSAQAQYRLGDVWQRSQDWTAGTRDGASYSAGNPDDDVRGYGVWAMEWVEGGGGLGSEDVWYDNAPSLMLWADDPFGSGIGRWLRSADAGPQIWRTRIDHDLDETPGLHERAPVVRWTNPTHRNITVRLTGPGSVLWGGIGGTAFATDADVVIARVDAESGEHTELLSRTVSKPTQDTSTEVLALEFEPISVRMGPHDQIVFSIRGHEASPAGAWVVLQDEPIRVQLTFILDCEADFNSDGIVDFFDYLDFVYAFDNCGG